MITQIQYIVASAVLIAVLGSAIFGIKFTIQLLKKSKGIWYSAFEGASWAAFIASLFALLLSIPLMIEEREFLKFVLGALAIGMMAEILYIIICLVTAMAYKTCKPR